MKRLILACLILCAAVAASQTIILGTGTLQTGVDNNSSGSAEAWLTTASATGSVTTLAVYVDANSTSNNAFVGVYTNGTTNHPKTLLVSAAFVPVRSTWNMVTIPATNVTANTKYWVALLGLGSGTLAFRDKTANTCNSETSSSSSLSALPASWTTGHVWGSCPVSIYGTSGTLAPPPPPITISVTPTSATVITNHTQQFSSTVTGTTNTAVTWSNSGVGTVDQTGLYTASSSTGSATVTATSQADTTKQASASVTITSASTYSISGTITPVSLGTGSTLTLSGTSGGSTVADANGNYQFSSLGAGTYTITPSGASTYSPASQQVTIINTNVSGITFTATSTGSTLFYDDFTGTALTNDWTIIQRHGEYSQNETECNIVSQVGVASGLLTITTAVGPATCGDFYPDGTVRTPPSSWPYITGDVQWNTFSFLYGTLEIRGRMPLTSTTATWPAYWLLGTNCQTTNKYSGDTGFGGCPNILTPSYDEIDLDECFQGGCRVNVYHDTSGQSCMYPNEDANYHVFTMVWQLNSLTVKRDGQQVCRFTRGVPAAPMFLIIQNQTGGVGGTPNNSRLPTTMQIDYVKVTQP